MPLRCNVDDPLHCGKIGPMENSVTKISQALLDLASAADAVLYPTSGARAALKDPDTEGVQRRLLERIDGFRSIEQVLAMSGDLVGAHGALGKLMAAGCVALAPHSRGRTSAAADAKPVRGTPAVSSPPVTATNELEYAKRLLLHEAKRVLGAGAAKLQSRIDACRTIDEIYTLIVRVQDHLASTGKADPGVFLDRFKSGLASARTTPTDRKRKQAP